MTERLLNKPYWVIDFLPEQVPEGSAGQYFAVENYYLQPSRLAEIHRRFTDILLKLNCYYDYQVWLPGADRYADNPPPEELAAWIRTERKDLLIVLPGEEALITLNHDDLYMTVYNPSGTLRKRIGCLTAAEGLFFRQPKQE